MIGQRLLDAETVNPVAPDGETKVDKEYYSQTPVLLWERGFSNLRTSDFHPDSMHEYGRDSKVYLKDLHLVCGD